MQELLGRAKAPSAFLTPPVDSTFHPKYKYPIKVQDWEVGLAGLDLSKLLTNVSVTGEPARYLNKKKEIPEKVDPIEEVLYDPLYEERVINTALLRIRIYSRYSNFNRIIVDPF